MATPVWACGAECGIGSGATGAHWSFGTAVSFSTATVRSGARSIRVSPSAQNPSAVGTQSFGGTLGVLRYYFRAATLPSVDVFVAGLGVGSDRAGLAFKVSDGKVYAGRGASGAITFGATGVTVTTNTWFCVDIRVNVIANPWVIDARLDGVALGTFSPAVAATTIGSVALAGEVTATYDHFFDDFVVSTTTGDYPFGAGNVYHFIPTSDGTHNVAGANDFERSATGTDITNATTTAFQLVDDVPLKSGVVSEYINLIAPPNATDYVELVYGPAPGVSTPTVAPRAVEAICAYASASAGTNNLRLALNDNGTTDDILNTTVGPGTTATYIRKHYATAPTGGAWIVTAGAGNFNNIRIRCLTNDAAPDPWFASAMIEAEFAEEVSVPSIPPLPLKFYRARRKKEIRRPS